MWSGLLNVKVKPGAMCYVNIVLESMDFSPDVTKINQLNTSNKLSFTQSH